MSRSVNKVFLLGHLGEDPGVNYTRSGTAVSNVSLATSETWNDKSSGERMERTEWHRLVFFGNVAEIVSKHLHKGSKIHVEGRNRTRKWQDNDGIDRWTTEVVVGELAMCGDPQRNGDEGKPSSNRGAGAASADASKARPPSKERQPAPAGDYDDFDDDIPY